MEEEGYLTLAIGQQRYLDMALLLAMSLKVVDPKRPVCLVTDNQITLPVDVGRYFDYVAYLEPDLNYVGVANKLRFHSLSPFQRTMFLDADCIMIRDTVDGYWRAFRGCAFGSLGEKVSSGRFRSVDVSATARSFNATYMVSMNSGAFYFEAEAKTDKFFELANYLYLNHRNKISFIHQGRSGQFDDQSILGWAMGILRIEPQSILPDCGSLMVTTWRARNCYANLKRRACRIDKPIGFHYNLPLPIFARGWVVHHPVVAHFVGLKPRDLYRDLSRQVHEAFLEVY